VSLSLSVVGGSHVSAFRNAWSENPGRWPGVEAEFFGVPSVVFQRMVVTEKLQLMPQRQGRADLRRADLDIARKINGREKADLSGADLVIAVGVPISWDEDLLHILDLNDVDGLRSVGRPQQMSAAAFDAILGALVERSQPAPSWRHEALRDRLIVMQRPLPSQTAVSSARPNFALRRRIAQQPEGVIEALGRYVGGVGKMLEAQGIRLFPQPLETIAPEGLTLERFTRGFRRLRDGKVSNWDHIHANATFGTLCLDRILAAVGIRPEGEKVMSLDGGL
jgi:hypothetical protein